MTSPHRFQLTQLQPNTTPVPSALRYYDPELQNASNTEPFDRERFERACERAKQLESEYLGQVALLADRVSERTFGLISDPKHPLFDAELFEFSFGDSLGLLASTRRRLVSSARATFGSFAGDKLHVLTYSRISALAVNIPSERWFDSPSGDKRIDSLLANEVTAVDEKLMQHVFLFVSGTSISIQFERLQWKTRKVR